MDPYSGLKPNFISDALKYRKSIMSDKYVIQWISKVNGRAGKGTKEFDREEAEELVQELNEEYPDIQHEAVRAGPRPAPEVPSPAPDQVVSVE
jgi:hypothetical protein